MAVDNRAASQSDSEPDPRMLSFLHIRGLALLRDVAIHFESGLNVLTGETGAGKSIIVDALTLLRGSRARADLVRAGEEAAVVEAQFEVEGPWQEAGRQLLSEHNLGNDELAPDLVLHRTVTRSARSRCFVQGQLTTREILSSVASLLIDVCSQHEHHSLTQVSRHLEVLDGFARLEAELSEYAAAYDGYRSILEEQERLSEAAEHAQSRRDLLRYQLEEFDRIAPTAGERTSIKHQVALLRDSQRWAEFVRDAEDALYESDDSIAVRLGRLVERSERGAESSPRLGELAEHLHTAQAACEEALRLVQRFGQDIELDPGALERAEQRLHELTSLEKKHGTNIEELATSMQALRGELEALDHVERDLERANHELQQCRDRCRDLAAKLHESRELAARQLSRVLTGELAALHMPDARFDVQLSSLAEDQLGPRGFDRVEFLFSANQGEPLAPLTRVASGGELSRVLLAIRGALAGGAGVSTYVFDEIDAGVGGAVAEAIGLRLARAARERQVLCITHLPQIAAFADAHFRVDKQSDDGRTTTTVHRLTEAERVDELARMLGGQRVSDTAREHARQLIADARRHRTHLASSTRRSNRA